MLGKKIGVDLGTGSVRMAVKGEGLLTTEPSVVGMRLDSAGTNLVGMAALEAAAGDGTVLLRRPLQGGAIVDPNAMRSLVQHVVTRAVGRQRIFKPDIVFAVMSRLPSDQRRGLLEAAMIAGARTAYLLDAGIAAGLGAGVPLGSANAHLVVDIGAGKTDVAALALEGTVAGRCLSGHGGQRLAACVSDHIQSEHRVILSPAAIEDLIASLARVGPHEERRSEVVGVDEKGQRLSITITSTELSACIDAHVRPIAAAIDEVLAEVPVALLDELRRDGGILCGGGSLLEGIDHALSSACGMTMRRDGDPLLSVVRGTGYASDNLDVLKRNFMYIR